MGRRGPPPQPTALRLLKNNPGKRPLPEGEPKFRPIAPRCPAWLDKVAKQEFRRAAKLLQTVPGLLQEVDGTALACYAQAYSDLVTARAAISKHGMTMIVGETGYLQQRPEVSIAQKSMQLIKAFCAEFGMTPSARGRLQLGGGKPPQDEEAEYEGFRRGKARGG